MSEDDEQQKKPPSQFDGGNSGSDESGGTQEDLSAEADAVIEAAEKADQKAAEAKFEFTRGVILLANEDYSAFKAVESFEFEGQKFDRRSVTGMQTLVKLISEDLSNQNIGNIVLQKLINEKIPITAPTGQTINLRFIDLIAQVVSDTIIQKQMKEQIRRNPKGIIIPGQR